LSWKTVKLLFSKEVDNMDLMEIKQELDKMKKRIEDFRGSL